jgi:hypothetical protein
MIAQDGFNGVGQPTLQGRGQASVDYFWNKTVSEFQLQLGRTPGSQGVQPGETPRDSFNAVCASALQNAADRATAMGYPASAADSRVVGVYFSYAVGSTNWFMSSVPSGEYSDAFAPSWNNEVNNPAAPGFAYDNDRAAYAGFEQDGVPALDAIAATWRTHVNAVIAANPSSGRYFTCVALNEFEPQVGFEVSVSSQATAFTTPNGRAEDEVWADVKQGYAWPAGTSLTGEVVAYPAGAFDPATTATPPAGLAPLGSTTVSLAGPGRPNSKKVSIPVGSYDGRVVFVVTFRAASQPHDLLLADATHEYGLKNETSVVPSALGGASQVTVKGGQEAKDAQFLEDTFVPAPLPGELWPAGPDGRTLAKPVFRWTAYKIDEQIPAATTASVPAGAVKLESGTVTASGPNTTLTAKVANPYYGTPASGSVIWVWELRAQDQTPAQAPYIVAGWSDGFAVETEITHVPAIPMVATAASVRHTAAGTYFVDDVFKEQFPEDYGDYVGSLGFSADVPKITHSMLWFPTGLDVTEANRAQARVVGSVQIPAGNGFDASVGSTRFKVPGSAPGETCVEGVAVFTSTHPGSARLLPLSTSVEDVAEQYPVTCAPEQPSIDVEKADEIAVGAGNGADEPDNAGEVDHDTKESAKVATPGKQTPVTITVTNNADETLRNVWVSDETLAGEPMVVDVTSFVVVGADGAELVSVNAGTLKVTLDEAGRYGFAAVAGGAESGLTLAAGQSIRFTGTIPAQEAGVQAHADRVTVGGTGEATGILVGDSDEYHTTVPVLVTSEAYSINPDGPYFGDEIGDRLTVLGDIGPGETTTVRLYAGAGAPTCDAENLLAEVTVDLVPGQSEYDTGGIYPTLVDRTDLKYWFVHETTSRGLVAASECGLASETVTPTVDPSTWGDSASGQLSEASGNLAITGARNVGLMLALAAGLAIVGGSLVRASEQRKKRQAASA